MASDRAIAQAFREWYATNGINDTSNFIWHRADAIDASGQTPTGAGVYGLRQGNWPHPDGGRIVGWVVEPDDVERMKADAFCLPRELAECLVNLRNAHRTLTACPRWWLAAAERAREGACEELATLQVIHNCLRRDHERSKAQAKAAREIAEQWNADARAEGFGGGSVKGREIIEAMEAAFLAANGGRDEA